MFDEFKASIFLFISGVIVAVAFAAHYLQTVDEANALLLESRHKLDSMSETITLRTLTLTKLGKAKAAFDQESTREQSLTLTKAELEKRHRHIEGDLDGAVESMRTLVEKARREAPNAAPADIALTDGRTLRAAKISKLDDSSLTIIHADGVNTVPVDRLPADITRKYDLGAQALLPKVLLIQSHFHDRVLSPLKELPKDNRSAQMTSLTTRRISLEHQLELAAKHKDKLEQDVRNIEKQIKNAEAKDAYTLPLRTLRDVTEGNAGMARKEWQRLQMELETTEHEIQQMTDR